MQQCCSPVAKPVWQQRPFLTSCHSFHVWCLHSKLTITGIWLAEIPRSGDAGTRLLSWTLLRFRRFVETFVPPGDATKYFCLFVPTLHTCHLSLLHKVEHSSITWDTYLCYKAGYKFQQKVCVGENKAGGVSGQKLSHCTFTNPEIKQATINFSFFCKG